MISGLDYLVIAVYFAITLGIGFLAARGSTGSADDFFVARKTFPWWVVGLTMVAASISAEQMLGEVAYGYGVGLAVSNWDLGVFPSLALMVLVFLPLYLRSGITTIPEYLEKRYSKTTRLLFAGYTVLNNACVALVMVLALGATALKYFLGLDPLLGAALLAFFTGIYTVYGGMASVAWTDTFQCVLLLAGGLTIFGVGLAQVPGGWEGLFSRMPDPHLIRPMDDPCMPWPGLILLALSTNVWYCCTNQFYVQASLGAKSQWHGRMGVLLTAFLGPILTLCFAFPGYIASDLIGQGVLPPLPVGVDGSSDANATYPHLVTCLLGPGLRGFQVAAVLGAVMSTISSITNATASVFTVDIYRRWLKPAAVDRELLRAGRLAGAATLCVAYPLTLVALDYRYIFTYSQNAWAILAIPIMLVFTLGALWRRATSRAASAAFLFVLPFVLVPFLFGTSEDSWLTFPWVEGKVHLFVFAFVLWIVTGALMVVASWLSRAPEPSVVEACVWRPGMVSAEAGEGREPLRWYQRIGFWCAVAGLMYLVIYWKFW